ncbi:MAG: TetR/AcrR family transcriptional regulator C-terminal domain-containing protein [Acidimicrobiales bacterium]|nr:TetR/AcrR family transcriptional regulator C-terminal domain-containing protein [Acidimicrobiales bacterium]
MPRPRSLTPARIAAAALAVVERDGLSVLSMRAVAGELGVGAMTLYRYVDGRVQLEGLVVDLVLSSVDVSVEHGDPWPEQLAVLAERVREAVGDRAAIVPLLLTQRHATASTVRWGEAVLGVLTEAGFAAEERVIAFRTVLAWLLGAIQVEHLGPLSGAGTDALAGLPADRFPHLAETASHARGMSADVEFRRGLAIVLRGLVAAAPEA